ncbi:MAG: glutamate racemase [Anaerolineales bacterium]|nr:glutamate racemase [Anaerolineales bacterium]
MNPSSTHSPIGVFDSGVGGLSVLRALRAELPGQPLIYIADQAHVPYGPRPLEEVRAFSEGITRFLIDQGARLVVVACNAASAAALSSLRSTFPAIPFVGMEPAVKPAAENSASRVVAVLATPATFQGALYASVVERFANGVTLLQDTCPGLVAEIENGGLKSRHTRRILAQTLEPMLAQGADTVVLGCTHYPFVIPLIEQIAGPGVRVIDPAPAVARQARRMLENSSEPLRPAPSTPPREWFYTTGDPQKFSKALRELIQLEAPVGQLHWRGLTLSA